MFVGLENSFMSKKPIPIFGYPEYKETFDELYDKLLNESGRGAVLVGTAIVEEHLKKYLFKILPSKEKNYTSKLLNYPGPLSSFSAMIELSYAFRLIPKNMYDSLNNLRKLRNDAAHSGSDFNLINDQRLDCIFDLGDGFRAMVHNTSMEIMLHVKVESLKSWMIKDGYSEEAAIDMICSKMKEKEILEILNSQLPHWKLMSGLSMICGFLTYYSDETLRVLSDRKTWGHLPE